MNEPNLTYQPSTVSPPGSTLLELLEERGITQAELARRMGRPLNPINEMILGAKEITEDTALELERFYRIGRNRWNCLTDLLRVNLGLQLAILHAQHGITV